MPMTGLGMIHRNLNPGGGTGGGWTPGQTPQGPRPNTGTGTPGQQRGPNTGTGGTGQPPQQGWQQGTTPQGPRPEQSTGSGSGTKQATGPSQHRTVFRLLPVTYQLSIIYLGYRRVRHAPTGQSQGYHTRFSLTRGTAGFNALDPIDNCVRHEPNVPSAHNDAVSLPLDQGGDNRNPRNEVAYRVRILDNHALRDDDGNLIGSGGDNKSKPTSYTERDFIFDEIPDVPFRVVVRKFIGRTQVDVNAADIKVLWHIKDPPEELSQVRDARARTFVTNFMDDHRRDRNQVGDDNGQLVYSGHRDNRPGTGSPLGAPGVKAPLVLFQLPYIATPAVDTLTPPSGGGALPSLENVQDHPNPPVALAAAGATNATSDLTQVAETVSGRQVQVGVSDVLFRPNPIGGDNYRFLLNLTNAAGADIRTTQDENRTVRLVDRAWNEIPAPKLYVTPRFVVWRRIDVRLMVWTNKLANDPIGWDQVKSSYREAFVDLRGPQTKKEVTRTAWRDHIQAFFAAEGIAITGINNDANYPDAGFGTHFWPVFVRTVPAGWNPPNMATWIANFTTNNGVAPTLAQRNQHRQAEWNDRLDWDFSERISRRIINDVCTREGINPPQRSTRQMDSAGFFLMLTKPSFPGGTSLGMYMAEQQFFMRSSPSPTVTFAHELGHGLYLRHGITTRMVANIPYVRSTGSENVTLYDLSANCFPIDHDHNNTVDCIMSYDNDNITTNFCGGCIMSLRFYDLRQMRTNYMNPGLTSGMDPAQITIIRSVNVGGSNQLQLHETFPNIARNSNHQIATIANFEPTLNDTGRKAAKLLDTLQNASYTVTPAGAGVTVAITNGVGALAVSATATPQQYTVNFMHNGTQRATKTFTVV